MLCRVPDDLKAAHEKDGIQQLFSVPIQPQSAATQAGAGLDALNMALGSVSLGTCTVEPVHPECVFRAPLLLALGSGV